MRPVIQHFLTRQFLGFLAVGSTAAALHWAARWLLSHWLPFGWAVTAAYGVGLSVAFWLNSRYVFPRSDRPRHVQARDFVAVNLLFFPVVWLAALGIDAALRAAGLQHHAQDVAHAIAVGLPTLFTFLIYKFVAFREGPHAEP